MALPPHVVKRNREVTTEFRRYFRLLPKVVAFYAADYALTNAMRPAQTNFRNGEVTGKLMPHNSSNAAWNWRISFSGPQKPLYDIDKPPVGGAYEGAVSEDNPNGYTRRSSNSYGEALNTVVERREKDIQRKLYSKLFSSITAKMPKFSLYNTIDELNFGKRYVDNSNVVAAYKEILATYLGFGEALAISAIRANETGGKYNTTPNVSGLMAMVSVKREDTPL